MFVGNATNQSVAKHAQNDDLPTLIAIGLLGYASADIAHHVLGHAGMCLALGGHVLSLSSIYVNCTVRGSAIDLAGPFANLIVGLISVVASVPAKNTARLFLTLAAVFNLLWFSLQLAYSAATRTDDFAWPMAVFQASKSAQYMLIAAGLTLYLITIRFAGPLLSPFGQPITRGRRIAWTVWLTAGCFACITAMFERNPGTAIFRHAAPQSFGLAVGILFLPRYATREGDAAPFVDLGILWILTALALATASVLFLGPGFAI